MQINEAKRVLEIAGYEIVDQNECSLDNLARLIKETFGISAKVNQDGLYFDYDVVEVDINKIYEDNKESYCVNILDEATNKSIYYNEVSDIDLLIQILDKHLD